MTTDLKLGEIIEGPQFRDAIHIAVAPVEAAQTLEPGEHVGILADGRCGVVDDIDDQIGIVDPFLRRPVRQGERFWLMLYPKTITSLRHYWEHPSFSTEKPAPAYPVTSPSEKWLREFAARVGLEYEDMMHGARNWIECDEYLNRGELLEGQDVPEEFWIHYAAVTGKTGSGDFFTCSC